MANKIIDIAGPLRFTAEGYPAPAVDVDVLEDSILAILKTGQGERIRRPEFGCGLNRLMFGDLNQAILVRAQTEARRAIEQQELRVVVDDVIATVEDSKIKLEVLWRPAGNATDARSTQITF